MVRLLLFLLALLALLADFRPRRRYTPEPDYSLAPGGTDAFKDFDFDRKGDRKQKATFPQPEAQLLHYRKDLNFRFGGIRKPRLGNKGNITMAKSKGWMLKSTLGDGENSTLGAGALGGRNLNYSIPAVRDWYQQYVLLLLLLLLTCCCLLAAAAVAATAPADSPPQEPAVVPRDQQRHGGRRVLVER